MMHGTRLASLIELSGKGLYVQAGRSSDNARPASDQQSQTDATLLLMAPLYLEG
jgi:hypothetical protein